MFTTRDVDVAGAEDIELKRRSDVKDPPVGGSGRVGSAENLFPFPH